MAGFETLLATGLSAAAGTAGTAGTAASLAGAMGSGVAAGAGGGTVLGAAGAAGAGIGLSEILQGGGTVLGAGGQIISGTNAQAASKAEAAELRKRAAEERAAAQREASERRRRANLLVSRSQAVSAASGAGATDPTVLGLEGGILQEGDYQADVETYLGETRARGLNAKAAMTEREGKDAYTSSLFSAGGTILSGVSPYFKRYGSSGGAGLRYG